MKQRAHKTTAGFSLLELVVATAMLTVMVTSVAVLLRTSQNAWEATDSDHGRLEAAHAVLRHLVRHLRQADEVVAISAAADNSGTVSARMPSGETCVWSHTGGQVLFGPGSADSLLAEGVDELYFVGFQADGATATEVVTDIQSVLCTAKVTLPRGTGIQRTVRCWAWLRAW